MRYRSSPTEWSGSRTEDDWSSPKTSDASRNVTSCFCSFSRAFSGSHSNTSTIPSLPLSQREPLDDIVGRALRRAGRIHEGEFPHRPFDFRQRRELAWRRRGAHECHVRGEGTALEDVLGLIELIVEHLHQRLEAWRRLARAGPDDLVVPPVLRLLDRDGMRISLYALGSPDCLDRIDAAEKC